MNGGDGAMMMVKRRAEIDTSSPFRSVKEAVTLFGERVLAGEVYANKLKEMQNLKGDTDTGHTASKLGIVATELEETKQSLHKAKEDGKLMATSLCCLQQELERTKRELQQLKEREPKKQMMAPEIEEDIKFVELDATNCEVKPETKPDNSDNEQQRLLEFQKKRYVTFANPPSLARVMIPPQGEHDAVLERHPSLRKKKKKPLIPLIGGLFSKKKGSSSQVSSPRGINHKPTRKFEV